MDALRGLSILFVIEGHVRIFGMGIKSYDTMSALIIGAGSYHGLSIYDKEFKGIHFIMEKLFPNREELFYDRIDFILLPIIGCILAFIIIEPSNFKTAFFAGLTWSGTLVAILRQKGGNNG